MNVLFEIATVHFASWIISLQLTRACHVDRCLCKGKDIEDVCICNGWSCDTTRTAARPNETIVWVLQSNIALKKHRLQNPL